MAHTVKSPMTFLALGDSYTIGESVPPDQAWPRQLVRLAAARGVTIGDPLIVAKTGWTTDELMEGVIAASVTGPFDLVSLLIGVNNLYRGRSSEEFRTEFRALLALSVQLAGGRGEQVRVLSIPDWGATPFADGKDREAIRRTTDRFNAVCREEARTRRTAYVDVTESSREGLTDPTLLTSDHLHPSGIMYARWAELVLATISGPDDGRTDG